MRYSRRIASLFLISTALFRFLGDYRQYRHLNRGLFYYCDHWLGGDNYLTRRLNRFYHLLYFWDTFAGTIGTRWFLLFESCSYLVTWLIRRTTCINGCLRSRWPFREYSDLLDFKFQGVQRLLYSC